MSSGSVENYYFIYPGVGNYGSISITKRIINFAIDNHTGTYTGEGHLPEATALRLLGSDAAYVKVVIDSFSFEGDNVNVNDGNCFAKVERAHLEPVAPGILSQSQLEAIANNYQMNYEKADVNEGRITIEPSVVSFTIENAVVTYNAEAHTVTPTVWGIKGADEAIAYLSYTDNVNAGTCVVTITGAGIVSGRRTNYVFEDFSAVRGEIVIAPLSVGVTVSDATVTYTGSEKQLSVELDKTLYNGDEGYLKQRIRYVKGAVTRYNPTDAGVWQAVLESVWLERDEKTNGNYTFVLTDVEGTLTIEKADYDFTDFASYLAAKSYIFTAEYNGKDQTPDFSAELPQGADEHLYTLCAVFDDSVKEVSEGQKTLHVTFRTFNVSGEAVDSPNYNRPTVEYTVTFSLTAKALPVVWGPVRRRTGGEEFVAVEYSGSNSKPYATAEGEDGAITLRVEVTDSEYGRVSDTAYHAVAMFEEGSAESYNYTLTGDRTEFYVVKKAVAVQLYGYTGLVYNGREQETIACPLLSVTTEWSATPVRIPRRCPSMKNWRERRAATTNWVAA